MALSLSLPSTTGIAALHRHKHIHVHRHGCPKGGSGLPGSKLVFNPVPPRPIRSNISAWASAHPRPRYLQHQEQEQELFFFNPLMADATIKQEEEEEEEDAQMVVAKLRLVAAAAADRAEMHEILAQQRDGWNKLLLPAFTNMTLAALILSALPNANMTSLAAALLYGATTALMCVVNKIQPSQLAEEQRAAARRFRQLNTDIQTNLAMPPHLRHPPHSFLDKAFKSVLALDKAYPLPLLPGMLNKFPKSVQPAVWWPQSQSQEEAAQPHHHNRNRNGWSAELEQDLRNVSEVLKSSDVPEYVRLSRKVLKVNTILAVAGPLLTGIAGALTLVSTGCSLSMVAGVLGLVANTLSHGGQIGMVFEMYRNSAGFYHLLDSTIQRTLTQSDPQQRENGELFLWRLALQLGRPPHSPLISPSSKFASKLF